MSIYELVNEIDNGEIVLPAIQRDFVWDEDRIYLLFDSMFRGYPVGIVMLWETYQPIQFRPFDKTYSPDKLNRFEENKKGNRIKLVLDGQQRLSSIYVALKGTFDSRKLYYDVLSGCEVDDHSEVKFQFCFATRAEARAWSNEGKADESGRKGNLQQRSHWIELSDVVGRHPRDLIELRNKIADQLKLTADDKIRMEQNFLTASYALSENSEILKTQTIDSKLPADDQKRKSAFDILEIFVRVNRQGVTLKRSDLIVSMLRLYWPNASELLPRFLKNVNDSSNINIDNDFVIRCMFSTADLGTRLDLDLLRKKSNVDKIKITYKACFESIKATVDFVRAECSIDSVRLLGGINTLVPFVYYLYKTKNRSFLRGNKADARRALYLFAFSKVFTQHSESRTAAYIRDHLQEVACDEPFSLRSAIDYVNWKGGFAAPDARLFGNNTELALSLIQRRTGGRIQLSINQPEIDHIFPRSVLEEKGFEQQEIHDFANLWILPRGVNRNKSAKHPKEFLADVDEATLNAAFVDRDLLDYRSFKTFTKARRQKMSAKLTEITGLSPDLFAQATADSDT